MRRFSSMLGLSLAALAVSSLGCTMCNTEHMHDYGGVGGKWQRGNPSCGRVGSILSDAGTIQSGTTVGFAENYGNSWGLIEGEPTPAVEGEFTEGQFLDGEFMEESSEASPEPSSIMIGP